jgi:hypothetical protein
VEMEAVVEHAAQGRKRRPQHAGDWGSMTDRGLITKGTCRHVIGSMYSSQECEMTVMLM